MMSFLNFVREDEHSPLSGGYRDTVASVFKSDLGIHTELARQILAYIPVIRQRRKNIPYLNPEEADAIHNALSCHDSGLCMRDRAIGMLLFFTGIRGCDISCMKFSDIDWEKEEIRIIQQKTANGLILPMSAAIGNAIYDYVTALFVALSPCEIYERKVTMQELNAAISSQPEKQAKRIYAHFVLGMSKTNIARAEGVDEKVVCLAIERGLRNMEKFLKIISKVYRKSLKNEMVYERRGCLGINWPDAWRKTKGQRSLPGAAFSSFSIGQEGNGRIQP